MKTEELFEKMKVPAHQRIILLKRWEKAGFVCSDGEVSEEGTERILSDFRSLSELLPFVETELKRLASDYPSMRIAAEVRKRLCGNGFAVLKNGENMAGLKPNGYFFYKKDREAVRTAVRIAVSLQEDASDEDSVSLGSMSRREADTVISLIFSDGFSLSDSKPVPTVSRKDAETALKRSADLEKAKRKADRQDVVYLSKLSEQIGVSKTILSESMEKYGYHSVIQNGAVRIPKEEADEIIERRKGIMPLSVFLQGRDRKMSCRAARVREAFFHYLTDNAGFGAEILPPDKVLFGPEEREFCYVRESDAEYLMEKSGGFWEEFGVSETEKMQRLLKESSLMMTVRLLREFLQLQGLLGGNETPSTTDFVRAVLSETVEIPDYSDDDVIRVKASLKTKAAAETFILFAQWVRRETPVKYHEISYKYRPQVTKRIAYDFETVVDFAEIVFSEKYAAEHKLLEKAVRNPLFAEMWLYHATFFVDAWRSEDNVRQWEYLRLDEDPLFLQEIDRNRIAEALLADEYPEEVFAKACRHSVRQTLVKRKKAMKTASWSPTDLVISVSPSLQPFFGKLLLIAESHHLRNGLGYMRPEMEDSYRNRFIMRNFYGPRVWETFEGENFQSMRMNHSTLQGIEEGARRIGLGPLRSHAVAAYARSHKSLDTLKHYVGDHALSGENPEFVLWTMMERGIWGVLPYRLLMNAFPEAFGKLSAEEQSKVIRLMNLSPYELEIAADCALATERIEKTYAEGGVDEPLNVLKAMLRMSQGAGGFGKDDGTMCLVRAFGESCRMDSAKSCLANRCPYCVFSASGIPALVGVIRDYQEKYRRTGNRKYASILKNVLVPNWKAIGTELKMMMSESEGKEFGGYLKEVLNGG